MAEYFSWKKTQKCKKTEILKADEPDLGIRNCPQNMIFIIWRSAFNFASIITDYPPWCRWWLSMLQGWWNWVCSCSPNISLKYCSSFGSTGKPNFSPNPAKEHEFNFEWHTLTHTHNKILLFVDNSVSDWETQSSFSWTNWVQQSQFSKQMLSQWASDTFTGHSWWRSFIFWKFRIFEWFFYLETYCIWN